MPYGRKERTEGLVAVAPFCCVPLKSLEWRLIDSAASLFSRPPVNKTCERHLTIRHSTTSIASTLSGALSHRGILGFDASCINVSVRSSHLIRSPLSVLASSSHKKVHLDNQYHLQPPSPYQQQATSRPTPLNNTFTSTLKINAFSTSLHRQYEVHRRNRGLDGHNRHGCSQSRALV